MAIEGIKSSVMSQVTRVEPSISVENVEAVTTAHAQSFSPVVETQGSGNQNTGKRDQQSQDEQKDIQDVSPEKVKNAISEINKKIRPTHTQCEFKFHEETNRISITVKDSETDEVIKEIPPEKTLDMIAKTLELAGLLVDEKR